MNHAFEFAELADLVQQLRQLVDINHTHACLVTEQQYNHLPQHFRQYITQSKFDGNFKSFFSRLFLFQGMNELQLQPAIGQISDRVRRPIGMLIYRRVRAIQGLAIDSLIQQNLIRPVDEVYDRVSCVVISLLAPTYLIRYFQLDNMEQNIQQVQEKVQQLQENVQQLQENVQQLQGDVQQLQGNIQQIMNHFQIPPAQGP